VTGNQPVLAVEDLEAGYRGRPVLRGIGFRLYPQASLGILGANGAGKSTLLKVLIGLITPARGRIFLAGEDVTHLPPEARVRRGLGYVPEGRRVFPGLTVLDNLLVAAAGGQSGRRRRLDELFALFPDLTVRRCDRAWRLSGGQQQMLALARALMRRPAILLLDEPMLGLAPAMVETLGRTIATIAEAGTALVLADEDARRVADLCATGLILPDGRTVDTAEYVALCDRHAGTPQMADSRAGRP